MSEGNNCEARLTTLEQTVAMLLQLPSNAADIRQQEREKRQAAEAAERQALRAEEAWRVHQAMESGHARVGKEIHCKNGVRIVEVWDHEIEGQTQRAVPPANEEQRLRVQESCYGARVKRFTDDFQKLRDALEGKRLRLHEHELSPEVRQGLPADPKAALLHLRAFVLGEQVELAKVTAALAPYPKPPEKLSPTEQFLQLERDAAARARELNARDAAAAAAVTL